MPFSHRQRPMEGKKKDDQEHVYFKEMQTSVMSGVGCSGTAP